MICCVYLKEFVEVMMQSGDFAGLSSAAVVDGEVFVPWRCEAVYTTMFSHRKLKEGRRTPHAITLSPEE